MNSKLSLSIPPQAKEDLAGTVEGAFSPDDWEKILAQAELKWRALFPELGSEEAWREVIRDFHRTRHWGFVANYRASEVRRRMNLGVQFIWVAFLSFTIVLALVVWFGEVYSRSKDPRDLFVLVLLIGLSLMSISFFLWRNRNHRD